MSKWQEGTDPLCEICDENDTIIHLLYECNIAKRLWDVIGTNLNQRITATLVILGNKEEGITLITSIIAFNICKYWYKCFNDNNRRSFIALKHFVMNELECRLNVNRHINKDTTLIDNLISLIATQQPN